MDSQDSPRPGLKRGHHLPPYSILVSTHGVNIQMSSCPGTPKLGIPKFLTFSDQKSNWLTPNHFFGHNLCFKYSNGTCEPILDIYVSRNFQWYKELFNPMSFDPCNRPLKIWESIGMPIPKVGTHLGVCGFIPSHFLTFPSFILGPHLCKPLPWSQAQGWVVTPVMYWTQMK